MSNEENTTSAGGTGIRPPKPIVIENGGTNASTWKLWSQQFGWYATATGLDKRPPEVQVAMFMSAIGPEAAIIYNTFGLTEKESQSLETIKKKFEEYFIPKTNVTYERYVFNQIIQNNEESFDEFLTKLKNKIRNCDYEKLEDSILRDRIIIGIKSKTTRERLLIENDLNLQKAIDICRAAEQLKLQMNKIDNNSEITPTVAIIKKKMKATQQTSGSTSECNRCGTTHGPRACPAYQKTCTKCQKLNHFAKCCRSRKVQAIHKPKEKDSSSEDDSSKDELYVSALSNINEKDDWFEPAELLPTNKKVTFKLDSGSQCNVIPKKIAIKAKATITSSDTKFLTSYSEHKLTVIGETIMETIIKKKIFKIKYYVIEQNFSPILGRRTCIKLNLIKRVDVLTKENDVFEGIGCLKNYEYDIDLIDNPRLPICPARKVPHIIRNKVKEELDNMVRNNIIIPVTEPTPAVSPMVVVRKNNKIRLCIDPSEINKNLKRRFYPLNTIEEIATRVTGSQWFSLLDCKKGFWQLKVTPRTSKYLTFSTPFGRYSCLRLPFGLASAPEVFQQIMSSLLTGINNVEVSMDDILIHHPTKAGLEATTNEVIKTLKDAGLKLNPDKCVFNTQEIKFLGHIFTNNGLKPDPEKLDTINKIKTPENIKELQRFLGLITYLSKFIKNLSHITNPLRQLLQKDTEWYWDNPQAEAFKQLKELLKNPPVLGFYNPKDPILLSVDASSYACGGVLMQNGKPIAYCAKAFTKTEQGYSQLEKEANAILVACKKFHTYIWGCKDLTIESDHKPLETIFKKTLSEAPPRLQRMLYQILPYNAKIIYKRGQELFIADTLSRDCRELSSQEMNEDKIEICAIMPFSQNRKQELKDETEKSTELRKLKEIILNGWPDDIKLLPEETKKYWYYREQLSVYDNMIFKNNRVLIPQSMVPIILKHCHLSHKSTVGTLQLARDNVFWPNMSSDVQDYVRSCQTCLKTQKDKPMETILLQEVPKLPWSIVASDIFHHKGKNFIVIADAYSGYFDFHELSNLNSSTVIKSMKIWFSSFGIPECLLTDNGKQYDSEQFKEFSNQWQFQHRLSSPHFPRSNGLAERYVQEAKNLLKKCLDENSDVQLALLHHRNTPRENLGSPVQRLMGRRTKTLLPINHKLLKPKIITNIEKHLKAAKQKEKKYADKGKEQGETFDSGEQVMLREDHKHWVPAKIIAPTSEPRSYLVEKPDGSIYRRNTWHLRSLPLIPRCSSSSSHNKPVLVSDSTMTEARNLNNVSEPELLKNLNMMVHNEQAELNEVSPTEQSEQSPFTTTPEPPPRLPLGPLPATQPPPPDHGLALPKTTRSGRPVILPKRYA